MEDHTAGIHAGRNTYYYMQMSPLALDGKAGQRGLSGSVYHQHPQTIALLKSRMLTIISTTSAGMHIR